MLPESQKWQSAVIQRGPTTFDLRATQGRI